MSVPLRIILSGVLLYFVWMNSHWSVALSLTFCFLNAEAYAFLFKHYGIFKRKPGPVEEWIASVGKASRLKDAGQQ